jgi:hypothetical protein
MFLLQIVVKDASFLIRQHAKNVPWEPIGERRKVGRTETGMVYQQRVALTDEWGNRLSPSSPAVTRKSFFRKYFRSKRGRWSSTAYLG